MSPDISCTLFLPNTFQPSKPHFNNCGSAGFMFATSDDKYKICYTLKLEEIGMQLWWSDDTGYTLISVCSIKKNLYILHYYML